jgi:alcohol dehydrogenase, propanol-preferring
VLSDEGAAASIRDITDGHGADVVLDFVGAQPTVTLATSIVASDGALRFVGLGGGSFEYSAFPFSPLPWGVDVRQSYAGTRRDQRAVIELAKAGKLVVETRTYALDDGVRAFDDLEAGKVDGRAVLVP